MRRTRLWLLILASVLGVVAVALLVVYVGLPGLVKWVIIHQGRSQLGRDVSIERVRLDAWNGWYRVEGLRIAGRPGEPPLLEVKEIDLRVVYGQLFRGRIRAHQLVITSPVVRLARLESGELSISDITRRFVDDEKTPASEKEPIEIFADLILVSNGLVLFEDRAVTPARSFEMKDLTINLRDITTKLHASEGTGTIAFLLNGTPVAVVARHVRVRPAHLTAQLNVVDFDVDEVWAYVPLAGSPVRPTGGRFSTSIDLVYDAVTGIKLTLDTILAGLTVLREGQAEPLLSLPQVKLAVRNLAARDGAGSLERLEVDTDTSIVDGSISPPRRYAIDDLHLVVEKVAYPSGPPANVELSMNLPEGATLDVRGTAAPKPLAANLTVNLASADLALVNAYIPPVSPITVQKGRVGATLAVEASEGPALRVNGEIIAGYFLLLRGQTPPLVEHPRNVLKITDFTWRPGAAAMRRLTAEGPATIVDASVSPPQRAHFTTLTLQADDMTFPVERPVRVKSAAVMGTSGSSTLEGTFNPATLAADIRARFTDVDVTQVGPYIPRTAPVAITGGRLAATVAVKHDRHAGLTVNADGAVAGLAVAHRGARKLAITDRRLAFAVDQVHMQGSALTIRRASLKGAPGFVDESATPARTLELRALSASVRDLTWPARRPLPVELTADLPEAGTLAVTGTAKLDPPAIDLKVDLKNAALGPYRVFLPFDAPIAGEASAALTVAARMASGFTAKGSGHAELRQFRLGPADRPPIAVESVAATGIDVTWPGDLRVDRATITRPAGLLERERDGTFPLRAMLAPRVQAEAPAPTPPPPSGATPSPGGGLASPSPLTVTIREIAIEEGTVRFVDQSTVPAYSEEISRLALKVGNVSTAPGERATLDLQAVVGATGALDLKGEIAPTADPFYLDVQGELREMPLPRSNPYFRQVFDWFLKRGTVTNKFHYRVVGDQLTAENDVRVQRLSVEKDTAPVASDKKIGVPLGLIVAMITDRRGDISFSLPVSGSLKEPGFSLGSAIWAALKNVLTNIATAPFQAIGKLFSKGDEVQEFKVDPLTFPAGSATVNAEGHQHLQRVADFLRASPNIHLELRPVVSAEDLTTLKTAEVAAQVQHVQRESKLDGFDAAAARLFAKTFPGQPVPGSAEAIVERLRAQVPVSDGVTADLATKRVESTRQALVQTGVEADRLTAGEPVAGGEGKGRVEFELSPAGRGIEARARPDWEDRRPRGIIEPAMNTLPLSPYTVIDLTRARSGPTCVRQLADMGARVIKVETRTDIDGDAPRHGFDFQNLHRNKRSMTLDLKAPRGREILERLVARADILVENFRPDVKHRLGIDYEHLSAVNPRLIYASISGFGQDGPYRDRPGYDQIAQGMGGLMSVTGLLGQGPLRVGIPIADLTSGLYLAQGVLLALLERERSGRGQWVHTSLLQAMVTMLDFQATRWLIGGDILPQAGNDHPTGIPTGVFTTQDGHINIAASGQTMFRRLCAALGVESLADDARFRTLADRSRHRKALNAELDRILAERPSAEWIERLNAAGVPSGPILNVKEVFENEQVRHLGLARPVAHPKLGELAVQAPGVNLARTPGTIRTAAPELGEHTDEVLGELGYSPADVESLRRDAVV